MRQNEDVEQGRIIGNVVAQSFAIPMVNANPFYNHVFCIFLVI